MSDMTASITINGRGDVEQKVSRWERAVDKFSTRSSRSLRALRGASKMAINGLDKLGNRYTALAGGAAGAGTVRYLVSLDTQITQLGVQAGKSADEMALLKREIYNAAQSPEIRVDPAQIIAAVEKIVEKTGDLELARENISNIGLAIRATGAAGQDVGGMIADMNEKFGIKNKEDFLSTLDAIVNQGKAGAFTLRNLATQGERVTAAYGLLGRVGPGAVREMGAMLQMIKRGVGGPEQAATALEALIRTLNDADKRKKLTGAGIQIVDPEDPKRMRSVIEIVKDVIKATNGDAVKLSTVFDAEAMRAFNAAIIEYNQTGGFASFDKFLSVSSDGSQIIADSARNAKTASAALGSLFTAWKKFADRNLTEPLNDLAGIVDTLGTEKMDILVKGLGYGTAALGAFIVTAKAANAVGSIRAMFGRNKRAGAAVGIGGGAAGAMPVIVTNWPGGGMDVTGSEKSTRRRRGGKLGSFARRGGKLIGKMGGPMAAMFYGADFAQSAMAGDRQGMAGAGGGAAGALAGGATGALIGSVVPVIGTAIGGLIGSILGGLGGEELGRMVMRDSPTDKKTEVGGTINIQVESDTPVRVKRLDATNPDVDLQVDTGLMMAGGG